jgi:hypoxanthine phosphoribosyltransferase
MLKSETEHLYINHVEYESLIKKLAVQLHLSDWHFDFVLCLARGGVRSGDIISRIFDKPLGILFTSLYPAKGEAEQSYLKIADHITTLEEEVQGNVLIVDDLLDTGDTIKAVIERIKKRYSTIKEIKVGVLWTKGHSKFSADYSVSYLPTNPWIHQPFEDFDETDIEKLVDEVKS